MSLLKKAITSIRPWKSRYFCKMWHHNFCQGLTKFFGLIKISRRHFEMKSWIKFSFHVFATIFWETDFALSIFSLFYNGTIGTDVDSLWRCFFFFHETLIFYLLPFWRIPLLHTLFEPHVYSRALLFFTFIRKQAFCKRFSRANLP